jgi:hypothetical protein
MKKPNKTTDMVMVFPLRKEMKREDYEKVSDKICELFPNLSVVWYVVPEKQIKTSKRDWRRSSDLVCLKKRLLS